MNGSRWIFVSQRENKGFLRNLKIEEKRPLLSYKRRHFDIRSALGEFGYSPVDVDIWAQEFVTVLVRLENSIGMSDSVPRLNVQRVVFHIADDMEWIKLKSSDFLTNPNVTIPMDSLMEKDRNIVWLNDSDSRNDDATKLALEEFDVTKTVQDSFVNGHETKSKKSWKDKGLAVLLKKALSPFPADDL